MVIGWVQDLRQAFGSVPEPLCATDKERCKPSESTQRTGRSKHSAGCVSISLSQRHVQTFRIYKLRSCPEAVNWVCDGALDGHVWVSEMTTAGRKNSGGFAIRHRNPCVFERGMLWFSAPTSLDNDLSSDGDQSQQKELTRLRKQSVGCVTISLMTTTGCQNCAWRCKKQKFWRL